MCAQIAKEEFDTKARVLLGDGNIQLHNEFLFAILVKCQLGIHTGKPAGVVRFLNPNYTFYRQQDDMGHFTHASHPGQIEANEPGDATRRHALWRDGHIPIPHSSLGTAAGEGLGHNPSVFPRDVATRPLDAPHQNAAGCLGVWSGGCDGRGSPSLGSGATG